MHTASSMRECEGDGRLTAFDYLYRDAGNFKSRGTILLRGELSDDEQSQITSVMEADEFFVAEQVSTPALYAPLFELSGGRIMADHAWHSFSGFRSASPEEGARRALWSSARDVVAAFERVGEWDVSMSPNSGHFLYA